MTSFTISLKKAYAEKVIGQAVELHKAVALTAFRDISATANAVAGAYGSPLWSGRFRASNNIAIGSPDLSILPPHPTAKNHPSPVASPYPSNTNSEASIMLGGLKPFDKVYISNNLPYARRIEVAGWSAQVPNGVYGVALQRVKNKYGRVLASEVST